ncbi:hypothetical protein [Pontibacter sp. HSC-36F09]|uniref:hypothetical protein n=1 Tax=Pontibacter sp. HSC-36F09 TaxID=2910966 RepID=UPI00209F0C9D|nr:hypothetical protein [Pontibacter sp. HSC-36F09]MCP2043049.1 hypothetical protein [Pontibacter sp. HSC-36F09]
MNKNVLAVFAAVCGLFMISCDTPKDLRPEVKVSNDTVPPGTRGTYNVSDAGGEAAAHGAEGHGAQEVMPNHDQGAKTIQPGDSVRQGAVTNSAAGADKQ